MNCLLNALAMSFGLMCVLSLKVIELLSCCGGRLCASPCMVFQWSLFITFFLHFFLSWTSFLSISSSAMSAFILSNHALLGRPTVLPSTLYSIHFFTQSSSLFLITYPYHLSLPLLMTVMIGSNPTNVFHCHSVFYGNTTHSSNHMHLGSFTMKIYYPILITPLITQSNVK